MTFVPFTCETHTHPLSALPCPTHDTFACLQLRYIGSESWPTVIVFDEGRSADDASRASWPVIWKYSFYGLAGFIVWR